MSWKNGTYKAKWLRKDLWRSMWWPTMTCFHQWLNMPPEDTHVTIGNMHWPLFQLDVKHVFYMEIRKKATCHLDFLLRGSCRHVNLANPFMSWYWTREFGFKSSQRGFKGKCLLSPMENIFYFIPFSKMYGDYYTVCWQYHWFVMMINTTLRKFKCT